MTTITQFPDTSGERPSDAPRANLHYEVRRFDHPLTRMLLAGEGWTTIALDAIVNTHVRVKVIDLADVRADRLPHTVTGALHVSQSERVLVRRSLLMADKDDEGGNDDKEDEDDTGCKGFVVSLNHVVAAADSAPTWMDDVTTPIGRGLMSRGVVQRRRRMRAGPAQWHDGRTCAARSYVLSVDDHPLCYIRESFNPAVVPSSHSHLPIDDVPWNDEPSPRRKWPNLDASAMSCTHNRTNCACRG